MILSSFTRPYPEPSPDLVQSLQTIITAALIAMYNPNNLITISTLKKQNQFKHSNKKLR